ncbi:hypothetical protein MML48_2g00008230 [Holotrichia oblita]|uniref:Uncharacterized protein n=1 Tax=Holotrichia oblita TaxID=644536 RepID=A0ACB9TIW0_HOLOL|nr:hypothetical protein MML48_2g00008230 [Holotrichia oblita]
MAVSPSRSLPPLSHRRSVHSGNSDLLQNKLRQLLVCDSAEELSVEQLGPLSPPAEYAQRCHKSLPDLHCRAEPSSNKSSNKSLSNRDSGGSSGHYTQRSEPPPPPRQTPFTVLDLILNNKLGRECDSSLIGVTFPRNKQSLKAAGM